MICSSVKFFLGILGHHLGGYFYGEKSPSLWSRISGLDHDQDPPLESQLEAIKRKCSRFGIRRAHAHLRAGGQIINRKRIERVWRKSGLQVPQRPKKRKLNTGRSVLCQAAPPNHVWSCDFQEDGLLSGRKLRLLNVLDEFTHEWLSVTVGVSLTSQQCLRF